MTRKENSRPLFSVRSDQKKKEGFWGSSLGPHPGPLLCECQVESEKIPALGFCFGNHHMELVVVVETVGNSARFGFWRRVFHSFHHLGHASRGWVNPFVSSTERETACYSWPDSEVRHTVVDAALSRADPKALGSLSPETNLSAGSRLLVLRAVEASPGADGLLCGQRSWQIFWPQNVRPLFFQDGVNARRQLPSHGHNGFARR